MEINLLMSFAWAVCPAMVSVIAKISGKVICLISSVDIRKALTSASKILASMSWLMFTVVRDFNTNDHI